MSTLSIRLGWKALCAALLVCSFATISFAQSSGASKPGLPLQIQASVPTAPIVFHGDGGDLLCYEIYLTNMSKDAWLLQSIEARASGGGSLLKLEGKDLQGVLRHPGRPTLKDEALLEMAPGERVIAYMWIKLAGPAPEQLGHELTVKKRGDDNRVAMTGATTKVSSGITTITSPLRGKNWLAGNGPSNTSPHRRTILVVDGTPHIAQRYAIDWVQIDEKGSTFKGDAKDNRNYYCYGSEAVAVADATVTEVKDGIPQNTPGSETMAVAISMETVAGNHVNLDLGGGVYAMYAHFQPGSIRVKVGDKVTRGQVLGLVGNSGNSSEPHLHFQLMNRSSPLASEGLPYGMDFQLAGQTSGLDNPKVERLATPKKIQGQIPLENEIVDF